MRKRESAKEISIKEIIQPLIRYLWLVILIVLLFASLAYFNAKNNTPEPLYQSSAKLIINASAESMSTLQVIIKDGVILEKVVSELNLPTSPEQLANSINVSTVGSSFVVIISANHSDPNLAADIANTTARVFKETIPSILDFNGVYHLSDAKVSSDPINVESSTATIIKIALVGLVVGIGLAYLLNVFDNRIRAIQEVEDIIGLPVIGLVSKINKKNAKNNVRKKQESNYISKKQLKSKEVEL